MSELSPANDALVDRWVAEGLFASRREALDRAVLLLIEEVQAEDDIRAGFASMERGDGIPLEEFDREFRAKYGIRQKP
jgi:Arc/MetJ-type ribon-helix-helix transcriptional regulator